MISIDLTQVELFKSFVEIKTDDIYVDLHNDFSCSSVSYSQKQRQLSLFFRASNNLNRIQFAEITFKEVAIEVMNFNIDSEYNHWTVDIMYRGRFAVSNDILSEITNEGKYYYYINFCDDYSFELFSDSVVALLR